MCVRVAGKYITKAGSEARSRDTAVIYTDDEAEKSARVGTGDNAVVPNVSGDRGVIQGNGRSRELLCTIAGARITKAEGVVPNGESRFYW